MRRLIRHVLAVTLLAAGAAPLGAPGAVAADPGNPAPAVQPGIREWQGGQGVFRLASGSRIILEPAGAASLRATARTFAADLSTITGRNLPVATGGTARAGDITLRADSTDAGLGPQGYALDVGEVLAVQATGDTGVFYATQTIEQALKLDDHRTSIPRGTARDRPGVEQRAQMLDVGRKYFPLSYLKEQIREMAWQKLNTFHLHLSDWSGFRIELDEFPGLASDDAYTPAELRELQDYARTYHVDVVPEIDLPGHATALTSYDPTLRFACASMDYATWPGGERGGWTLDITRQHTRDFVHDLLEAVIPLFDSEYFHVGGDEIGLDDRKNACPELVGHRDARGFGHTGDVFVDFLNTLNTQVRSHGKTAQAWEWWDQYGQKSSVEPDRTIVFDDYIDRDPTPLVSKGYTVVAAPEPVLYVSPGMGQKLGQYGYVDIRDAYENYTFPTPEAGGGRVLGYKVARWADGAETRSAAFFDHFARRPLQVMAARTWGSPGESSVWAFLGRVDAIGGPPGTPTGHLTAVPKAGMTATADSEESDAENGSAAGVIDDNPYTAWHTAYSTAVTPPPHHVTLDLGAEQQIAGFRYLPRQDAATNGRIGSWTFDVSADGVSWRTVARGTFADDQTEKEITFPQARARHVRLTAVSAANGLPYAGAAELTLLRPAAPAAPATQGSTFHLLNALSGKAVDVPASTKVPGARLGTWAPHDGSNQRFTAQAGPDDGHTLRNAGNGLCLDVEGGGTAAGAAVIQWTCTGADNQRWSVTPAPAGGFTLTSARSGLALTSSGTGDGAPLTQQKDTGAADQRWVFD
ncbi:family 20 glycosylhydrolase [Streptomyces sp. NPDC002809]|uniref:family 20 glycosylhydrolase n=1 Tax=Streptomyces sp. NPDC002809 TaxID=3154433 RepID=UPI003316A2FB